jgi:hypothetical protein
MSDRLSVVSTKFSCNFWGNTHETPALPPAIQCYSGLFLLKDSFTLRTREDLASWGMR